MVAGQDPVQAAECGFALGGEGCGRVWGGLPGVDGGGVDAGEQFSRFVDLRDRAHADPDRADRGYLLPGYEDVQAPQRRSFHANFTAGRAGHLVVDDEFASTHHARFQIAHGLWYMQDLGSTNGTWLNGQRFHTAQRLKKGDKIKIGHTVMLVISA